jgi:hypothetical protein
MPGCYSGATVRWDRPDLRWDFLGGPDTHGHLFAYL